LGGIHSRSRNLGPLLETTAEINFLVGDSNREGILRSGRSRKGARREAMIYSGKTMGEDLAYLKERRVNLTLTE